MLGKCQWSLLLEELWPLWRLKRLSTELLDVVQSLAGVSLAIATASASCSPSTLSPCAKKKNPTNYVLQCFNMYNQLRPEVLCSQIWLVRKRWLIFQWQQCSFTSQVYISGSMLLYCTAFAVFGNVSTAFRIESFALCLFLVTSSNSIRDMNKTWLFVDDIRWCQWWRACFVDDKFTMLNATLNGYKCAKFFKLIAMM